VSRISRRQGCLSTENCLRSVGQLCSGMSGWEGSAYTSPRLSGQLGIPGEDSQQAEEDVLVGSYHSR
jgi:hypothetical protein